MKSQCDIFISYAVLDNQTHNQEDGWVSLFHKALEIELSERLGAKPRIWRDEKLKGNDDLDSELSNRVLNTSLLLCILSPRYIQSKWCIWEVEKFTKQAEATLGLKIGSSSRIIKVVKTFVPFEEHPGPMKGHLGYEFFKQEGSGRFREYNAKFGKEYEQLFWLKLDDLVQDLAETLSDFWREHGYPDSFGGSGSAVQSMIPKESKADSKELKKIFLATTTPDIRQEYDEIKRVLTDEGCEIMPAGSLPEIGSEIENDVSGYLEDCKLSIHMLGQYYGVVPIAANHSVIDIQNTVAAQKSIKNGIQRMIWIPPELASPEEKQSEFLNRVQEDPNALAGAEVFRMPLEKFKTALTSKLREMEQKETVAANPGNLQTDKASNSKIIYLITNRVDLEAGLDLEDYLFEAGFEIRSIDYGAEGAEIDETTIREFEQEFLKVADAVLIYYGQAPNSWVQAKLGIFQKIVGYGRESHLEHKCVYIADSDEAPPQKIRKERFKTREAEVLRGNFPFEKEILAGFLKKLNT
ncbi:MAG: TIR domain-containing protein [Bacteroidia bacterium]|nr:TIR domain-containing protein [Bacteroidia bacterium]